MPFPFCWQGLAAGPRFQGADGLGNGWEIGLMWTCGGCYMDVPLLYYSEYPLRCFFGSHPAN